MQRIKIEEKNKHIWTVQDPSEKKFLLKKVPDFEYAEYEKKDIESLVRHMRKMMIAAHGVGLSANQIGMPVRLFVAQLPDEEGRGYTGKFYAIINPVLAKTSRTTVADQEGCLSVPRTYGTVDRFEEIKIEGVDKNGRKLSLKANGFLARIFQHETDHLNGILFTGAAYDIFTVNDDNGKIGRG